MEFKEKLMSLRKEKGLSQEELGDAINVTRQTISNWEGGLSSPDLEKIKALAIYFNVSTDELLGLEKVEKQVVQNINMVFAYEYKSKRKLFGLPLIHVNIGFGLRRAKGIIAIGNIATGFIAMGGVSLGLLSLGGLALGMIAFGGFALALLLAFGGFSFGTIALGGIAIGVFSLGGVAIGMYSIGGASFASEIGYGGYATGKVALNLQKNGSTNYSKEEIKLLIEEYAPKTWWLIKKIFIALGGK